MIKKFLVVVIISCIFTTSEAEDLLQADEGGKLQAKLQNVSLMEVSSYFTEKYGIKFIGENALLQTQVTTSFSHLTPEKALKRVFGKMNIALTYNSHGEITEVLLLPTSKNKTRPAVANNPTKSGVWYLPDDAAADPAQLNMLGENEFLNSKQGENNAQMTDEVTAVDFVPDAPLPGDGLEADPNDEISAFQVVPNTPPSGDSFKIVPSAPPSGNQ